MKSKNHSYLPLLDWIRLGAALWVCLYHCVQVIPSPSSPQLWAGTGNPILAILSQGWIAVSVFIVLSGFSLARGLNGKEIAWGRFFAARWLRVAPLYLFVLFLTLALGRQVIEPGSFFESLTMLPLPDAAGANLQSPFLWTTWSVRVEFLIYFFMPVLVFLASRRSPTMLVVILVPFFAALYLGALQVAPQPDTVFYWSFVGRLAEFAVGFILGYYGFRIRSKIVHWASLASGLVLLAGLALWANSSGAFPALGIRERAIAQIIAAIASALLILWANKSPGGLPKRRSWLNPVVQGSYSVYIWHFTILLFVGVPVYNFAIKHALEPALALILATTITVALTLAWSALSFTVIEKPFLSMRPRYLRDSPSVN